MNSDPNYNNCDAPEQPFEDDEAAAAADGACSDFEGDGDGDGDDDDMAALLGAVADDGGQSAGSDGDAPVASERVAPEAEKDAAAALLAAFSSGAEAGAAAMRDLVVAVVARSAGGAGSKRRPSGTRRRFRSAAS